jgi:hypothetical protein
MTKDVCRECGEELEREWPMPDDATVCFRCEFWTMQHEAGGGIIVDGRHYRVGPDSRDGWDGVFRGFGGRPFVVLLNDGRRIVTDNLWTQGVIPARFRGRLPDNARFVDE